jgi:hypothetical protein
MKKEKKEEEAQTENLRFLSARDGGARLIKRVSEISLLA